MSIWINIASVQPSLSEGRIICLTGTEGRVTTGVDLGLAANTLKIRGAFIQSKSLGFRDWSYGDNFNAWHNLIVTTDGRATKTYLDGELENSDNASFNLGTITSAKLGVGCIQWYGNMISGGPMGKYANINFWDKILSAAEIADVKSAMTYIPTDAAHRYDMNIQNGRIADVGTAGGWDLTTIQDFENGIYVP